jgi:ureidoglycolate lyase
MNQAAHHPRHVLTLEPLSTATFRPFGDVIEAGGAAAHHTINAGYAERFHDLARVDTAEGGGRPLLNIFRARPHALPLRLDLVERHRLGSQAFVPLAPLRFLVVVAAAGPAPRAEDLRCFVAAPGQGVNYARGTWHHPLLALDAGGDFLVIDRGGPGASADCDELRLAPAEVWVEAW